MVNTAFGNPEAAHLWLYNRSQNAVFSSKVLNACWNEMQIKKPINIVFIGYFGVPGAIRTRGLSLRRRMLYPAELQRLIQLLMPLASNYWRDLGGGPSILLRYGDIFTFYALLSKNTPYS